MNLGKKLQVSNRPIIPGRSSSDTKDDLVAIGAGLFIAWLTGVMVFCFLLSEGIIKFAN